LLFCKGWTARDSPLLVAPHDTLLFRLSFPFFVTHVLLFHSSKHTTQNTHQDKRKKEKLEKPKEKLKDHKNLKYRHKIKKNKEITKTLNKATQNKK